MNRTQIKTLAVGDMVCDCRFLHLKVVDIKEVWLPQRDTALYKLILEWDWLPDRLAVGLADLHDRFYRLLGFVELIDKDVVLEDGAHCSAQACLDPVNTHTVAEHPA